MTLNQLQKRIARMIEQGYGRCRVAVDKPSFRDNRENDGCVILPICGVYSEWIVDSDDDGGSATNKDGSERGRTTVIFYGDSMRSTVDPVPAADAAAALTKTGDMDAAFGPADGSGKWLPPSTRVYRTSVLHPHLCANCGKAPIEHSAQYECPADNQGVGP